MDLIPITRIKISKDKWLNTKIKYEEELRIKDILDGMCHKSYNWILSKGDLDVICDYDTFKEDFINLCYDKYLK
tara:strand:+ start:2157 stop:2378 length:222 start_codon:yes stop_codon:yes gene_type:complete